MIYQGKLFYCWQCDAHRPAVDTGKILQCSKCCTLLHEKDQLRRTGEQGSVKMKALFKTPHTGCFRMSV
jgi:hypothetical protein